MLLLALAPAAHGAVVEIDSAPGQILDVDATRILFEKSDTELGVKDRASQQVTTIAAPESRRVMDAFLTPHGVMFESQFANTQDQLHEVYDGVMTTLFS